MSQQERTTPEEEEILNIAPQFLSQSTTTTGSHSERVLFSYFSIMRRCAEKAHRLNIKQFDRDNKTGQSNGTEEIFDSVCVVNELLERLPCLSKYPNGVLSSDIDHDKRSEFLSDLKKCAEFKMVTTPSAADHQNKLKLISNDEVLTRNNHLVQKYDQLLEQSGSIVRFPTLYNNLKNSSSNSSTGSSVDQLVKKLNLEESVKKVSKDLHSSSPDMVSLIYNLSTAYCREHILNCIKKTSKKSLEEASFVNLSTCLGGSCTAKVLEYISEKSREDNN